MSIQPDPELSRLNEDVFTEVGRNVVMFQDIERMLKILLNRGKFTATASQLKAWKDNPPAPYAKNMLGALIEPLIEHHLSPGDPDGMPLPESREITLGFEFRVELTDAQQADFRARMETMVKTRNELTHHLLDWLRLDTVENCQSACSRLRRQREDMEPLYRDINGILKVFLESREDAASHLKGMLASIKSNGTTR